MKTPDLPTILYYNRKLFKKKKSYSLLQWAGILNKVVKIELITSIYSAI